MVQTALLSHSSWWLPSPVGRHRSAACNVSNRLAKERLQGPTVSLAAFDAWSFRLVSFRCPEMRNVKASSFGNTSAEGDEVVNEIVEDLKVEPSTPGISFLAKLAIVLGIAATVTMISVFLKRPISGPSSRFPFLLDASSSSVSPPSVGFTLKAFGYQVILPEYTPGWIYFWLLMAAGCGLFISEEALNIWLGIDKEKALSITRVVQKYGNLIGFVERFSLGVRNPTSFLAGALGISSECFFAGVCCGGLLTLPIQLGIGFFLRERPLVAIASVATAVGIWTLFPYTLAASTALFLFLQRRHSS